MKRALIFLSLLVLNYGLLFAEEQITITTYYPSPYGSYNALQADKLGVGDNNGDGSLTSADVPTTSGDTWIKGKVGIGTSAPGYKLEVAGDIYANDGWLRTGGATGWYNQDFGGGWNMSDSTWIRSYGSKNVYSDSVIRADGGFQVDGNQVIDADAGWHRTYGATGWYNGTYGGGWYMADSTWIRSYGSKNVYIDRALEVGTASSNTTNLTVHGKATIYNDAPPCWAGTHDVLVLANACNSIDLFVDTAPVTLGVWGVPLGDFAHVKAAAFDTVSDIRLKKNIKTLTGVLDRLDAFRGVSFNWRHGNDPGIGVIAQEVEKVFPEAVITAKPGGGKGDVPEVKSINTEGLTAVALQGLKELKAEVRAQADTIRSQAKEIAALKQRLK